MGVLTLLLTATLLTTTACVKDPADSGPGVVTDDTASAATDSGGPADDTAGSADTGGAPGGADTADSGAPVDCDALLSPALTGEGIPGEPVALRAGAGAGLPGYAVLWTAPHGDLEDPAAPETVWMPDPERGRHVDRVDTVQVEAWSDDCAVRSASLDYALSWPERERVVVIYNPSVEGSQDVALAYAAVHEIPDDRLCAIATDQDTTLAGEDAPDWLDALQVCIDAAGPQIHYLVPVYGVPYRVSGRIADFASGAAATTSLDALAVFGAAGADFTEAIYNPLYRDGDSLAGSYRDRVDFGAQRVTWEDETGQGIWLVSRMDAADPDAALALVERAWLARDLAAAGGLEGVVYVDGRYGDTPPATDVFGSYESGEWNMWGTRTAFEEDKRYAVVWDGNSAEFGEAPAPEECPDALYYAGWYSYYNYNDAFTWAPGAIGGHLDSCSACDIRAGGVDGTWAAGALERGITATFGAVAEPYVAGMPEYDQLFRYLLDGASYGEAAAQSTVIGVWMMVWIGDPLYRPYGAGAGP